MATNVPAQPPQNPLNVPVDTARKREETGKKVVEDYLVTKGVDPTKAKEMAEDLIAAGFCIIGGGVPI